VQVSSLFSMFTMPVMLDNQQSANATVWAGMGDNDYFVAVDVVSATLTCHVAYLCTSGACKSGSATSLCAQKEYIANGNCTNPFPTPHPQICPAVHCLSYCGAASLSPTCNAQMCPGSDSDCHVPGTCSCGGISAVTRRSAPSLLLGFVAISVMVRHICSI